MSKACRFTLLAVTAGLSFQALGQGLIEAGPSPYEFLNEEWVEPFAAPGFTFGGTSSVVVQSPDRIFMLQRGETELPDPLPPEYTTFAGSMGWNVLRGRGRVWQNCIYVIDSDGNVLEIWDHWDHLFVGTDGPGPHKLRISPYDPDKKLWLVDETNHIIYVFSNDGNQLVMTLGEKGISGRDETHYHLPQDVAFLPDGKFLVADGLGDNKRIVIRSPEGRYLGEFGEGGDAPHQFTSVHSLAWGPNETLYALDRDKRDVKVFRQTAARNATNYPQFEYVKTWTGLGLPLDITVSADAAWVTDLNPPKVVKFDLEGNPNYVFNLPVEGQDMWIEMHALSVDDQGNVYATDNQAGRPQKLVPKPDADPNLIIKPPYVPR